MHDICEYFSVHMPSKFSCIFFHKVKVPTGATHLRYDVECYELVKPVCRYSGFCILGHHDICTCDEKIGVVTCKNFRCDSMTLTHFGIDWVNGLLPDDTKPLPDPISTIHQWGPVVFTWGQLHRKCAGHLSFTRVRKLPIPDQVGIFHGPISWFAEFSTNISDILNYYAPNPKVKDGTRLVPHFVPLTAHMILKDVLFNSNLSSVPLWREPISG